MSSNERVTNRQPYRRGELRRVLHARLRMELMTSTRTASPLALDIIAEEGVSLGKILQRIRPAPLSSRAAQCRPHHFLRHTFMALTAAHYAGPSAFRDEQFRFLCDRNGVVLRKPSSHEGGYGVWFERGSVNVAVTIGRIALQVDGSLGRLTTSQVIP